MKTADRNKHLEFIEPLSNRKVLEETYIMVADMKDDVIRKPEFKMFKSVTFGFGAAIGMALIKLGFK